MGVLREGAETIKAEDDEKFGFHSSTTILSDIYCKITTNSDYRCTLFEIYCKIAMNFGLAGAL